MHARISAERDAIKRTSQESDVSRRAVSETRSHPVWRGRHAGARRRRCYSSPLTMASSFGFVPRLSAFLRTLLGKYTKSSRSSCVFSVFVCSLELLTPQSPHDKSMSARYIGHRLSVSLLRNIIYIACSVQTTQHDGNALLLR